jgi:Divergent InlB B-repeat domain
MIAQVWPISTVRASKLVLIFAALLFSSQLALAQFTQQGPKLVGSGAVGGGGQGSSVALSADGSTVIVGGGNDNSGTGAVWVFTGTNSAWTQQGSKLVGSDAIGLNEQGCCFIALSADGNTAAAGGPYDNSNTGAVWIYARTSGVWAQQGSKLIGTGAVGLAQFGPQQGRSVALTADGNKAIIGGPGDNGSTGAVWTFTRTNGVWTQQGSKLVGTGGTGSSEQGYSVALSADGTTAVVGGLSDGTNIGAVWVFTWSNGTWTQQGSKLVGSGAVGAAQQGSSVALSADGNTVIVGGPYDNSGIGAVWIFTRTNGVWVQQGSKLVGTGAAGNSQQGWSVAVSSDGNTALVGGPGPSDNINAGAAWVFIRTNGVWTQQGSKLFGNDVAGAAYQGRSVAMSADGNTAVAGGPNDNLAAGQPTGATWVYVQPPMPSLQVSPSSNIAASGPQGGTVSPSQFSYTLSALHGSIDYAISGVPNWLTPSSTTGIASVGSTVTFTVNAKASGLAVGTYGPTTITFTNSDTGQGTQTRNATLTVNLPGLQVTPATNIVASGTQGGPFSPSSFQYMLSATSGSLKYSITNLPNWLTVSPNSGTVTTSAKTITFRIDSGAHKLSPNTYVNSVNFHNTTNNQGNTTRVATLTVAPKQYTITLRASPSAYGTVSGGGAFVEGTSHTVTATPNSGHTFFHWTQNARVVSTSESYTFTLNGNVTLFADFR